MNLESKKKELIWKVNGYKGQVDLEWSPDGHYILASRREGGIIRWLTAQDSDKDTIYYLISIDSKSIRKLGVLK